MRFLLPFLLLSILFSGTSARATEHTFEITWTIGETAYAELAGFRLYDSQHHKICETTDTASQAMRCTDDVSGTEKTYSLVSYATTGIESDPSDPFTVTFEEPSSLVAIIHFTTEEGSLAVNFDGTDSTGSIMQYNWDFGDGSTDTGSTVEHTFPSAGSYTVTLTIQDENKTSATTTQTITLDSSAGGNQPPTAHLTISSSPMGKAPLLVTFDASESSDPENSSLTYYWDFGDGTTETGEPLTRHQYSIAGTYTAKVTVTDDQGVSDTVSSQPIMVTADDDTSGTLPTAVISASRLFGIAPLKVSFSGEGSLPSEQTGHISQYRWNFGDGTSGDGKEIQHIFTEPGSYSVELTITDNSGKQAIATKTLMVSDTDKQNIMPILLQVYKLLLLK